MSDLSEIDIKEFLRYKNTIATIVVVIIFLFIGKNIFTNYKQNLQNLSAKEKTIEDHKQSISEYKKLTSDYNTLAKEYFQGNEIALKSKIENIANIQRLQINSLSPSQKEKDFYTINQITIDLKGYYHDFVEFIKKIEIKNMEVERLNMDQDNNKVDVGINIQVLNLK